MSKFDDEILPEVAALIENINNLIPDDQKGPTLLYVDEMLSRLSGDQSSKIRIRKSEFEGSQIDYRCVVNRLKIMSGVESIQSDKQTEGRIVRGDGKGQTIRIQIAFNDSDDDPQVNLCRES